VSCEGVRRIRATSNKLQANKLPGPRPISNANKGLIHKLQAIKPQASSFKHQAQQASRPQASSPKQQASSFKPQASSSMILEPRKSFTVPGPRAWTMINVLCGCFTWKLIWCGENRILFPLQTFNSTVKKCPELLQPNRSGVPSKLLFSSLIHEICGIDFLIFS
jgi:hypothetical protein